MHLLPSFLSNSPPSPSPRSCVAKGGDRAEHACGIQLATAVSRQPFTATNRTLLARPELAEGALNKRGARTI